ncbi:hypothetical protein F0562_005955 [Nyssa sinensis]|uniref:Uncharacterized protein n=1 Tax=Nyssa sinensis TaxID=561372 RepID=A0A5J5ANH5_9ASTE|nr:hypothetical protein F0562_005955 [Nyssa sinensis]
MTHPRVGYLHTPLSLSADELMSLLGGEDSVDLVTVSQAVHCVVSPTFNPIMKHFHDTTLPFWNPDIHYIFDGYRTLPFPFESVGLDSEGKPLPLDIPKELSFDGFVRMLRSLSAVTMAKETGMDLLSQGVVNEFESAWGGSKLDKSVTYKAFILVGKVNL